MPGKLSGEARKCVLRLVAAADRVPVPGFRDMCRNTKAVAVVMGLRGVFAAVKMVQEIEYYLKQLHAEVKGMEERIAELKKEE